MCNTVLYQISFPLITFDFSQQLFCLGSSRWNYLCFQGTSDNESKDPDDEAGDEEGVSKKDLPQGEVESKEKDEEKNDNEKGTTEEEQQQEEEEAKRKK